MSGTTALSSCLLLALGAAACGPRGAAGADGPARPPDKVLPQDQTLTLSDIEVRGVAFEPQALGFPAMAQVTSRARFNLDRLRRHIARKNPDPVEVHQLVTILWNEAAKAAASDPTAAAAMREEGRAALRKLRAGLAAKVDVVTLEMLATAEMWLGDTAAAIAAYQELVRRFPQHPGARAFQTWLATLYLRQRKLAEAAEVVKSWKLEELGDMSSYVLAWIRFVGGDGEGARAAIARAVSSWREPNTRMVVERDLLLMLARSGASADQASAIVAQATDGKTQQRYVLMFRLSEGFEKAGRFADAGRALDIIVEEVVKGQMPPDDLVGFRFRQADYAFRQNQPGLAADRSIMAHQALRSCGERCAPATGQAVTERVLKLAQFSHTVYAKSQDLRHHDAAVKLYRYYLELPDRPDSETARDYLRSLEETRASAEPQTGKHDQEVMLNIALARREALAACYEAALLREPALEGSIKLSIDIDHDGVVAGAASDPAAGAAGLAAAAGCAVERARTWSFPSRSVPGKTVVDIPIQFRLQSATPPTPKSTPPG
jgi:tetratricopeptide (TPR) repeat protein